MIIKIPLEFKQIWEATEEKDRFLQHLTNIRRTSDQPFIKRRDALLKIFDHRRANPYDDLIMYGFRKNFICTNPDKPRFMHIDLGVTKNAAGISCCYVDKFVSPYESMHTNMRPYVVFDFVARIEASAGFEISFPDVEAMIYSLARRKFRLCLITFDRFQSINMMQNLRSNGFIVSNLSIDKTTHKIKLVTPTKFDDPPFERVSTEGQGYLAWQSLKDVIYENRLSIPYYEPLEKELDSAEWVDKSGSIRVVSRSKMSLDCLESVTGSVFNAINNVVYIGDDPMLKYYNEIADPYYRQEQSADDPFYRDYGIA